MNLTGGLIVLGLWAQRWKIPNGITKFHQLARQFFGDSASSKSHPLARIHSYIQCLLRDGRYEVANLERGLQELFGEFTRMFDSPSDAIARHKIGVTAANISDATPFIFSNYNGKKARRRDCGYQHFRRSEHEEEILLWQAGRATSAAPSLFPTAEIEGVGTFQDGGLKHNNPVNIALWESREIWPSSTKIDVVLSLGTGTTVNSTLLQAPRVRDKIRDGFIPRVFRSFMSSLDGELVWKDLNNRLDTDTKTGYFRLNIPLTNNEGRLDDVRSMNNLQHSVRMYHDLPKMRDVRLALLASSFFFELATLPTFDEGYYKCHGHIRIRGDCKVIMDAICEIEPDRIGILKNKEFLDKIDHQDICRQCGCFSKAVSFYVRLREETITLSLDLNHKLKARISGFPQTMAWFIQQQALDSFRPIWRRSDCQCRSSQATAILFRKGRHSPEADNRPEKLLKLELNEPVLESSE